MDANRFDALTRSYSQNTTRRRLTRLLGGLALSGLLRPLAGAAEKGGTGKKDRKGKKGDDGKKGHKDHDRNEQGKAGKKDTDGHEKGKQNIDETKDNHGHKEKATRDGKQGTPDKGGTDTTATVTASSTAGGCRQPGESCSGNLKCCFVPCSKRTCPPTACGDGVCNGSETCSTCPQDCGNCAPADPCAGAENRTPCANGKYCWEGLCVCNGTRCDNGCSCVGDKVCKVDGTCGCPAGTQDCNGYCANTQTDGPHCGSCGHACGFAEDCVNGQCVCNAFACLVGGTCEYNYLDEACGTSCTDCTAIPVQENEEPWTCQRGECVQCGDGVCNGSETCSTCPQDCGPCPSSCETDAECVPATCCHPSYCVHRAQAPVCDGIVCTADCVSLSMGCGQGGCACQDGLCVAVYWGGLAQQS